MKTLKIPNYSFLLLNPYSDSEISKIQEICEELGYKLSRKECMHLWAVYSEALYVETVDINKKTVQDAITYIEKGVIWSINQD